jgi:NADPH2:quinone reductase
MGGYATDFGFEQSDPHIKLAARITVQAFAGEEAGRVAAGPGTIVRFHCGAAFNAAALLSTGLRVTRRKRGITATWARQGDLQVAEKFPQTMTAIGYDAPGGPEVLRPETVPVPRPGPDQVLVKVAYAGVNRPDVVQRQGNYPPPPGASPIPGLEIAGRVVAAGEGVARVLLEQPVCALVSGGGYAEYCLAEAAHCLPVPASLPLAEAAALPETLFTVWHNVFERGWVADGETILVHGGTSGIGTMAILLGKAFGVTVIVTCGGPGKCARALEIGAAHAIDYKARDFVEEVKRITAGRGVNMVLDMVAGDYVPRNLRCLAEEGRHVTIAVQGGAKAELNMAAIMSRRYTLSGSTLRPRSNAFKALLAQEIAGNAWPLVQSGALRPVMDRTFPLRDAASAHARMEAGEHVGKIVLEV